MTCDQIITVATEAVQDRCLAVVLDDAIEILCEGNGEIVGDKGLSIDRVSGCLVVSGLEVCTVDEQPFSQLPSQTLTKWAGSRLALSNLTHPVLPLISRC